MDIQGLPEQNSVNLLFELTDPKPLKKSREVRKKNLRAYERPPFVFDQHGVRYTVEED